MKQEELTDFIDQFKEKHMDNIQNLMLQTGDVPPLVTILVMENETEEVGVVMVPMLGSFQDSDKETLAKVIIPEMFQQLKTEGKIPLCFSFTSEAWLRKMPKPKNQDEKDFKVPDNWKDLEKIEGLVTTFETKEYSEIWCKEMHRVGKTVNSEGQLIDQIELRDIDGSKPAEMSKQEGRFSNIFKKYGF